MLSPEAVPILVKEMDKFKSIMFNVLDLKLDYKTVHFFELTTAPTVKMLGWSVTVSLAKLHYFSILTISYIITSL